MRTVTGHKRDATDFLEVETALLNLIAMAGSSEQKAALEDLLDRLEGAEQDRALAELEAELGSKQPIRTFVHAPSSDARPGDAKPALFNVAPLIAMPFKVEVLDRDGNGRIRNLQVIGSDGQSFGLDITGRDAEGKIRSVSIVQRKAITVGKSTI